MNLDSIGERHLPQISTSRPSWSCLVAFTVGLSSCTNPSPSEDESAQASETTQSETDPEDSEESESESETGEPDPSDYDSAGPHPVGNLSFELADPAGVRPLRVELWYPASAAARTAAATGQALIDFELEAADRASLEALVDVAPDECVRKQSNSAAAPELASVAKPLPTVVFSHCHGCARFSSYSLAERLASHGFLVAAVDHAGSTLFDQLLDELPPLDASTLELRRDDVIRVIDELLDPAAASLPSELVGLADGERLGVFGHSFGAVTTGLVLQDDPRPRAGVAIAAPLENPVLPGVMMAAIAEPLLLIVAVEDNSITEFGNMAIRTNFTMANPPVWKLEFADTGHFGFADLAGLSEYFAAGCGDGERQTDGEPFSYADPFAVRSLAATRVTAFFALHLLGDEHARAQLEADDPLLDIDVRD